TLSVSEAATEPVSGLEDPVHQRVDLFKLQPSTEHPHGLTDADFDSLFTTDKQVVFDFHGYPWLIHRLTYARKNKALHVRGYKEKGNIKTPRAWRSTMKPIDSAWRSTPSIACRNCSGLAVTPRKIPKPPARVPRLCVRAWDRQPGD